MKKLILITIIITALTSCKKDDLEPSECSIYTKEYNRALEDLWVIRDANFELYYALKISEPELSRRNDSLWNDLEIIEEQRDLYCNN